MKSRRAGFTLIELLVVMAIIGVLATLLLPTLANAKAAAKSAKCKSNLRQMGLALGMYLGDFSKYPLNDSPVEEKFWFDYLEPYTGSKWEDELFSCPTGQPGRWRGVSQIGGYGEPIGNYGYNKVGCGLSGQMGNSGSQRIGELGLGGTLFDLQPPSSAPLAEAGVKVPSDMIALADAMQRMSGHVVVVANATLMIDGIMLNASDSIWGELEKPAKKRHSGSANVTFCDGHTESIKLLNLFGRSDATLRRWNNDNLPHRDRLFNR